jgi:lipopolysaccharide export system permease protein
MLKYLNLIKQFNPFSFFLRLFFPKIIDRYLFKTILPYFLSCIFIFSLINFIKYLSDFVNLAVEYDTPILIVIKAALYLVPFLMTFTISIGLLIGVLLSIGNLSANNEIIALRSMGVSNFGIFRPILILGILVFIFQLAFFEWVLPWGNKNFIIQKYNIVKKNPISEIQKKQRFQSENKNLKISYSKDNILYDITLIDKETNTLYYALKGKIISFPSKGFFKIQLFDVSSIPYSVNIKDEELTFQYFENFSFRIALNNMSDVIPTGAEMESLSQNYQSITQNTTSNTIKTIGSFHQYFKTKYKLLLLKKSKKTPSLQKDAQISQMVSNIAFLQNRYKSLEESIRPNDTLFIFHKKLAFAISSIFMAIIALPLAIFKQRQGKEISIALCIIIVVIYNSLLILVNLLNGTIQSHPLLLAWLPNMVIVLLIIIVITLKLRNN